MIAVGVATQEERRCAALDGLGPVLGEFAATAAGYVDLQRWAESDGNPDELRRQLVAARLAVELVLGGVDRLGLLEDLARDPLVVDRRVATRVRM